MLTVVGTFLPWLRSGRSDRSSFELLDIIESLGFTPAGPMGWAVRLWPVIPLVCAIAAVLAWRGVWPLATVLGIAGAGYAAGLALVVRMEARDSGLYARYGSTVSLVGSVVLLFAALLHAGLAIRRLTDDG